jgi:uncharacterized protein YcfL
MKLAGHALTLLKETTVSIQRSMVLVVGIVAAGLVSGCNTAPVAGQPDEAQVYPNITLSQSSLQGKLGFNTPSITRTANNMMQVAQPIRARANEALFIEYRFVFLDAQKRPLQPLQSWTSKRLEPRQPDFITGSSTSTDAIDYSIQLRWGKP